MKPNTAATLTELKELISRIERTLSELTLSAPESEPEPEPEPTDEDASAMLTVDEAAAIFRVSRKTIYDWLRRDHWINKALVVLSPRHYRFDREVLGELLAERSPNIVAFAREQKKADGSKAAGAETVGTTRAEKIERTRMLNRLSSRSLNGC